MSEPANMKQQAVVATYKTLGRALSFLPEALTHSVADLAGDAMFYAQPGPRRQVMKNLRRVLESQGGDPSDSQLYLWSKRSYRAYARYWVEGARLGGSSAAELQRNMVVTGFEYLEAAIERGNGVILALPHVGSWEYGGAYLSSIGYPMTVVAERLEPPELFDFFVEGRAAMGLTVVPLDASAGGKVARVLRDGGIVGLLSDRDIEGSGVEVEFFGETTTMPAGPATMALRTGATLLTVAVYSGPGRTRRAVVEPPIVVEREGSLRQDVVRLTQEIACRFEGLISEAPDQWPGFQPLWLADRPEPEQ